MDDADAGATQDLEQLYVAYAWPLQRYLWRLTGSREQAEDLVQETFVKALRAYSRRRSSEPFPMLFLASGRALAYRDATRFRLAFSTIFRIAMRSSAARRL